MIAYTKRDVSTRPKVSLCMIVRDNEDTIAPCLESIRPWVDEMIVVDTGSKDQTPQIAGKLGAQLYEFPWCDDFSAARNVSLNYGRGEWLFWMDSDDTIDAENGQRLQKLAYGEHQPSVAGYVCQVHCPADNGDFTVVDHVKLIRNHPAIRFEGRIHEQVLMPIRRLGGEIAFTDIHVVHSGADYSEPSRKRKCQRDLHHLELDLQDRPNHPFVLFNFGMTYSDMGEHVSAIDFLRRCLEVSEVGESHLRKAYAILVTSLTQLKRLDEAFEALEEGRRLFPDDPELLFREGILAHDAQDLRRAASCYREAMIVQPTERRFESLDPGIRGSKARNNLAVVFGEMGRHDLAEVQAREMLAEQPTSEMAWRLLAESLLAQGKLTTAQLESERMEKLALACQSTLLRAKIAWRRGDVDAAKTMLTAAIKQFPDRTDPLETLCRLLFENGDDEEAEQQLIALTMRSPQDGAAWHNLGVLCEKHGRLQEAADNYVRSLEVRPGAQQTQGNLERVMTAIGTSGSAGNAMVAKRSPKAKRAKAKLS